MSKLAFSMRIRAIASAHLIGLMIWSSTIAKDDPSQIEHATGKPIRWAMRSDGTFSLVVAGVEQGSWFQQFGLQPGDRVVSFAQVIISSPTELQILAEELDTTDWQFTILRDSQLIELRLEEEAIVGEPLSLSPECEAGATLHQHGMECDPPRSFQPQAEGMKVHDNAAACRFGFETVTFRPENWVGLNSPALQGALVHKVLEGSLAAETGLAAGSIIISVDGKPILSRSDLHYHLSRKPNPLPFVLLAYEGDTLRRHVFAEREEVQGEATNTTAYSEFTPERNERLGQSPYRGAVPLLQSPKLRDEAGDKRPSERLLGNPNNRASPMLSPQEKEIARIEGELHKYREKIGVLESRLQELKQ